MGERRRDRQLKVKIDRGVLSISIGLDLLKHALEYAPQLEFYNEESEEFDRPKIADMDVFAEAIAGILDAEDEDGTTPVHRLLDKAALAALEQGADGVELPEPRRAADKDAAVGEYSVHMTETRHYVIEVEACDVENAKREARKIWREAPDIGGYEYGETETDIASVLEIPRPTTHKGERG